MTSESGPSGQDYIAYVETRQKQAQPYMLALGQFVSAFSQAEAHLAAFLWKAAGIDPPVAQAVFSGIRTDAAMQSVRRIADAEAWPTSKTTEVEYVFAHLSAITKLRNDILHYGATMETPTSWKVTNRAFVHIPEKVQESKISAEILNSAAKDLATIVIWCLVQTALSRL